MLYYLYQHTANTVNVMPDFIVLLRIYTAQRFIGFSQSITSTFSLHVQLIPTFNVEECFDYFPNETILKELLFITKQQRYHLWNEKSTTQKLIMC